MPFLLALLLFVAVPLLAADDAPRTINADWTAVKGPTSRVWQNCVGAGRANEGLRADWQQQLAGVQRDIGFRYIRFHGLFHDDMGVYREGPHGEPIYNWQYVDKLFDFLLSVKIRPFVELGFLPSAMQSDPKKTVFWWKGQTSPPKDFSKWGDLVTALVRHCEERYGQAEVKQWYFEVWNEPNLHQFWSGTREQYFQLYEVSARAVKSVSSEYRVGGPATAGSAWLDAFVPFVVSGQIPIDFISTHAYGTDSMFDEFGKKIAGFRGSDYIPRNVAQDRALIDASPLKGRELHFTEWNSSSSPKDPRHDTYQNAAFVLHVLRHAEAADSMSLWTFTDIFEEPGPQFGPFHGGFGLLNLQGIRKPTFYAYEFLRALGPTELQNADGNSYVCRDDADNFQVLLWDFAAQPDQAYANAFFSNGDHPEDRGSTQIAVKNVPSGNYKLSIYRTGYGQNDPLDAFRAMDSPQNLSREQESKLKALSDGHPVEQTPVRITDGVFRKSVSLKGKDVVLLKLERQP